MTTTASARAPRSDAARNRAEILRAAQEVIARDPRASIDAIAAAAGLSRRALYGHFADRDALLAEVIALGAERFNAIAATVDDADPRVALARLAARLWREAASVRASVTLALDDAHVADTARALDPLRARLRRIAHAGAAAGAFRRDLDADLVAALVEETARATLRELDAGRADAASIVVRVVLSVAGLAWTEQEALLAAHPEIVEAG